MKESLYSHPKYRPDIDGLRAVAILSVVIFHAFPNKLKGGFTGVDIFFVISGFLISTIIFENLSRGTFSFGEFYTRRIRRIFPALIFVLLTCLILGWLILIPEELHQLGKHTAAGVAFISNFILWNEAGYFDNSSEAKPLLHLWSLSIEEQFYIVWPLLLWFSWKQKFNLLTVIVLVALTSLILNLTGVKQDPIATFYSPQTRFWELLSGSVLAWFTLYGKQHLTASNAVLKRLFQDFARLRNVASFVGAVTLIFGFYAISKDVDFPGAWATIPVLGTVLIILGGPSAWINRKVLSNKVAVWFGLISFPLYLWHWPILSFLKIVEGNPKSRVRLAAVIVSVVLAWLTVRFIEKPFRFGHDKLRLKTLALCGIAVATGLTGFIFSRSDFSDSHGFEQAVIKRKGAEHAVGSSLSWLQGSGDWLFLGNAYSDVIAKLKLATTPTEKQVSEVKERFLKASEAGMKYGAKTVLIVGPDKSSIYPEYLPDKLTPSAIKYSSFFLTRLKEIPQLTVYDPTHDLLEAKKSQGILYWMTDTHWNNKGAFVTFAGFSKLLNTPVPNLGFTQGAPYSGDLIGISKLKDFPLHPHDNWDVVWNEQPVWVEKKDLSKKPTEFGAISLVTNDRALSNQYVWVVGDSFTGSLRQYFNATFKKVRYLGPWQQELEKLPDTLKMADIKPDLIVVVRVERSF